MLLVVPGNQEYNTSAAVVVRQMAIVSKDDSIHFGMVDSSKQAGFLSNFNAIPAVLCLPYHPVSWCELC